MKRTPIQIPLEVHVEQTIHKTVNQTYDGRRLLKTLRQAYCRSLDLPEDAWVDEETQMWMHGTEAQPGNFEEEYEVRPAKPWETEVMRGFWMVEKGFPKG